MTTVKDVMHEATIVEPSTSLLEVARIMRDKNIGSVLVKLSELDYGIVTERDVIVKSVARDLDPKSLKASDVMTKLLYTIDSSASIQKASEIFNIHPIRRLPVMENGEIVGIITARDVAKRCIFRYYEERGKKKGEPAKEWR